MEQGGFCVEHYTKEPCHECAYKLDPAPLALAESEPRVYPINYLDELQVEDGQRAWCTDTWKPLRYDGSRGEWVPV